jgi:hypothetical protein
MTSLDIDARRAPRVAPWLFEAGEDITRANLCFLQKLAEMQASWLVSWWTLQAEWARGELPPWVVWHNGTEQLA